MFAKCANNAQSSREKCAAFAHDIISQRLHNVSMDIDWFKQRKRELKITDAMVAEALGVERSVANKVLNGRVAFNIKRVDQIAELFQCSVDEILYRLGATSAQPMTSTPSEIKQSDEITVWGKVAAGVWLEESFVDPDTDEMKTVSYDRMAGDEGPTHLFAVEPEGDSMNMAFMPGTTLICRLLPFGYGEVEAGDYVIVARESHGLHELTCKRIEIDDERNFLLFSESSNPKYQEPFRIPRSIDNEFVDGEIRIIGVVIREVRSLKRKRQ